MKLNPSFFLNGIKTSNKKNQILYTHYGDRFKKIKSRLSIHFLFASIIYLFPCYLFAQNCSSDEVLLIETSLLTGQVCEGDVANVSVDVTTESFFALNEIDSIQWFWYVDLPGQPISFNSILPANADVEDTTYPPFNPTALNSHIYDELEGLGCGDLEVLITSPPNKIEMAIGTRGFVTCSNGGVEQHFTTVGFDLSLEPRASMNISPSTICIGETTSFINIGCFGDDNMSFWTLDGDEIQSNGMDVIDYTPTNKGTVEVCLHLRNNCGEDVACQTLNIVPEPDALFSIPPELVDGEGCAGTYEFCNISDTINFYNVEYYWGLYLDGDLQGELDTQQYKNCYINNFTTPGDYELVLTATNFICDTVEHSFSFIIVPSAFAILANPSSFCISDFTGYTPDVVYTGDIQTYQWTFQNGSPPISSDPIPSNIDFPPGTHDITLEITSACGEQTYQTTITIDEPTNITFSPLGSDYCTGQEDTIKIIPFPDGGTWDSPIVINDSCIVIDDLPLGSNTFTYTVGQGACTSSESITINIIDTTEIVFETLEIFCEDDGIVTLSVVSPVGGTWSGTGIVDSVNGLIDVSIIGAGNTATIFYTYENTNNCVSIASKTISIEGLPSASLPQDSILLCDVTGIVDLNIELEIQLPSGYTDEWIGDCTTIGGLLDPVCLGIGSFDIEYVIFTPNGCTDTTNITVVIDSFQVADAGEDLSECASDGTTITLSGTPAGGSWTGVNISAGGIITVNSSMDGDYDYTYTFGGSNCENEDVVTVTIINLNDLSANLPDHCETDGVVTLPDGSPVGGAWVYNGVPLPNNNLDISDLGSGNFILNYEVEVITTTNDTCTNSIPVDLFIDAVPNPIIDIPTNLCINVPETIINNTVEQYNSWNWDFGNGTTATGLTPTFEYTATGNYTITLSIQDTVCQEIFTWDVSVSSPPPPLDFELNILSADSCELLEVAFINQSQVDVNVTDVIYIWDFGNGILDTTYSVNESPDNVFFEAFDADTIYTVTLSALNSCGVVTPATATVYVKPKPISQFSAEFEVYCSGAAINFINSSVGNPENTIIDLGDGSPLIYDYPFDTLTHQYFIGDVAQIFIVQFISTNPCGSDTILVPLEIVPVDIVSAFTVEDNGVFCQNSPICLTNGATPGASVWYEMGDGNTLFINDTCYVYSQAGEYIITQYAQDICGGVDTLQIPISVLAAPSNFISNSDTSICFGDSIGFNLILSNDVVSTMWDFGDGNISNEQNPIHFYQTPGIYNVTATSSSIELCSVSNTVTVVVEELLDVNVIMEDSICVNQNTLLENIPTGANFTCYWLINDMIPFSTCNIATSFDESGLQNLSLTLTDNANGCENKLDTFIYVRPTPSSMFDIQVFDICNPNVFKFYNQSTDSNTAFWDFGDGTTSSQFDSIEHIYSEPGFYTVTLYSSFDGICFDTISQIIDVPEDLNSVIVIQDNNGCEPFIPTLQNQSTGVNLKYEWSTSNGINFFGEQFMPSFSTDLTSENVTIQLIAIDSITNCTDTSIVTITVFDSPIVSLTADHVSCNTGSDGATTASVMGGTPGYQFDWSVLGSISTISNLSADVYTVTISDSNGCTVADSIEITEPTPILITLEDLQNATCAGLEDGLIDVQAIGGTTTTGNEYLYNWSVNQPLTGNPQDIITDLGAGFYSLTVTDENGCTESAQYTVEDGYVLEVSDTIIGISCEEMNDGQIQIAAIENGIPNFLALLEGPQSDTLNSDGGIFSFNGLPSGNYTLSIIDQNNCIYKEEYLVPSWQNPEVTIEVEDTSIYRCESALIVANATGSNLSYLWFPQVNFNCLNGTCDSIIATPEIDITYNVTAIDEKGCTAIDEVSITVDEDRSLYVPTAFTPNGDGINDIFRIRAGEHQEFLLSQINSFNIVDRWGNILYKEEPFHPYESPELGWDGTIEGVKAPSDIYVYWAELLFCDGKKEVIKGQIQLIR